jgi:hypothetical protein
MRRLFLTMIFGLMGLSAHAQTSAAPAEPVDPRLVILTGEGQMAGSDSDRAAVNALVEKLTQAFSKSLSAPLQSRGYEITNILDQDPKYSPQQKVAIFGVKYKTHRMVVLSLEVEDIGSDIRLNLLAQYVDLDFIMDGDTMKGVTPSSRLARSYLIHSNVTGTSTKNIGELVEDFLDYLVDNHRLLPLTR